MNSIAFITIFISLLCKIRSDSIHNDGDSNIRNNWHSTVIPPFTLMEHTGLVISVAYSEVGSKLASGSSDKTIKIWNTTENIPTLLHTLVGHESDVTSVAFNHDGTRIVSGSLDNTVKVWSIEDGGSFALLYTLLGHDNLVSSVAYNYDGSRIISGSWGGNHKGVEHGGGLVLCYTPS